MAEDGEFYNMISSSIYSSVTFVIPCFFFGAVYIISHGLLHDWGMSLSALGCLANYFTLNAIYDVGGMSKAAYKTTLL